MMPYKTILIIASAEGRLGAELDVALTIAQDCSAHLIGLAVLPPQITLPAGTPGISDFVTFESHRHAFRQEAQRMRALFTQRAANQGLSYEWVLDDPGSATAFPLIVKRCHAADLVIADAASDRMAGSNAAHAGGRLVIQSGRPVIFVPKTNNAAESATRVLIAWNGAREASRATFDAIPLLKVAKHVKVLRVNQNRAAAAAETESAIQLCGTLARHDIRSESEEIELAEPDVGPALLAAAKAENAGLLVMGCYGHSRLRELALGGASRHVLQHMSVPVLMSH